MSNLAAVDVLGGPFHARHGSAATSGHPIMLTLGEEQAQQTGTYPVLDITEPSASSLTLGGDWSLRLLWSLSVASLPIT